MRRPGRRPARSRLLPALLGGLLAASAAPGRAQDGAELELLGSAIARAGAPAVYGFPTGAPGLVSANDTETPLGPHDGHDDAEFVRDRLYRDGERVNAGRSFGSHGLARNAIEAGHSISVSSGWADAGSDELGAAAEANAGSLGPSIGSAAVTARIAKRVTILPGSSGLAAGTLVTGLRWVLDGAGSLQVAGRSFPSDTAANAGLGFHLLVLRGSTGTCGAFDCPQGALAVAASLSTGLAVAASLSTGLAVVDADPALPAGVTARVTRHDSWSASNNAGPLKGGAVFKSGSETVELGLPVTHEDVVVLESETVDTGAAPLALDAIEFEANVGETLRVEMDLDVSAALEGPGVGDADAFDTFAGGIEDPQARGLVFASSVPVPEPGRNLPEGLAAALLLAARARRALNRP